MIGEEFVVENYKSKLVESFKTACRFGLYSGAAIGKLLIIEFFLRFISIGLMFMAMFLDYSLSFWYGSTLVGD